MSTDNRPNFIEEVAPVDSKSDNEHNVIIANYKKNWYHLLPYVDPQAAVNLKKHKYAGND